MKSFRKFLGLSPPAKPSEPSSTPALSASAPPDPWPPEFLCPLSSLPMSDPVFLSSGESYERNCVTAWIQSGQNRCYVSGKTLSVTDDPQSLVSNVSLVSAIKRFCNSSGLSVPSPPSIDEARLIVAKLLPPPSPPPSSPPPPPPPPAIQPRIYHSATGFGASSVIGSAPPFPLPFPSAPQEEPDPVLVSTLLETGDAGLPPPSLLAQRLRSGRLDEQASALRELREITRTESDQRLSLAGDSAFLSALLELTAATDSRIQSDSIATIVNLSLQKENKVLLVQFGALQFLVEAMRSGCAEARGHAVAGLFSLATEENNRVVIAVAGAIPLLLRLLSSAAEIDRVTAEEAAMALFYVSLEPGNRGKMIRDGAIPILVRQARVSPESSSTWDVLRARCFMILCNLAVAEGRRALLGSDAMAAAAEEVERSTGSGPTLEHALALMLVILGKGNSGFMGAATSPEVIRSISRVAQHGKGRAKEKACRLLMVVKEAHAIEIDGDNPAMSPIPNFTGEEFLSGPRTTGF